jgi:hypothetical protein
MIWHHPLRPVVWALLLAADAARDIVAPGLLSCALHRRALPVGRR